MKKYIKPQIKDIKIKIEDIIAKSGSFGGSKPGDSSIIDFWS
jgi:hypothetical protein